MREQVEGYSRSSAQSMVQILSEKDSWWQTDIIVISHFVR